MTLDRKLALCAVMLIVGLMKSGQAQAQEQQFDLICSGSIRALDRSETPWSSRLSLDLEARAFAFSGARQALPIARIEPGQIVLIDAEPSVGFDKNLMTVSRANGALHRTLSSRRGGFLDVTTATCAMAPFTPLPARLF